MKSRTIGLALAAVALAPLAVLSLAHGAKLFASADEQEADSRRGMVAGQRDAVLARMTAGYIAAGKGVTDEMRDGKQLAPIAYLNARLLEDDRKWRVESVDGMFAETVDIS